AARGGRPDRRGDQPVRRGRRTDPARPVTGGERAGGGTARPVRRVAGVPARRAGRMRLPQTPARPGTAGRPRARRSTGGVRGDRRHRAGRGGRPRRGGAGHPRTHPADAAGGDRRGRRGRRRPRRGGRPRLPPGRPPPSGRRGAGNGAGKPDREDAEVRGLLWHVHGSWTTAFGPGGHEYLVPLTPGRGPDGRGRARTYPWPDTVREVPFDRLREEEVDVVVLQRPHEIELAERWLGRRLPPAVYVEHNTPAGDVPRTRH